MMEKCLLNEQIYVDRAVRKEAALIDDTAATVSVRLGDRR